MNRLISIFTSSDYANGQLEDEDIQQALVFASSYLDDRIIDLPNHYEAVA